MIQVPFYRDNEFLMFSILLHSWKILLELHFEPSIWKTLDKIFRTPTFSYQLQVDLPKLGPPKVTQTQTCMELQNAEFGENFLLSWKELTEVGKFSSRFSKAKTFQLQFELPNLICSFSRLNCFTWLFFELNFPILCKPQLTCTSHSKFDSPSSHLSRQRDQYWKASFWCLWVFH